MSLAMKTTSNSHSAFERSGSTSRDTRLPYLIAVRSSNTVAFVCAHPVDEDVVFGWVLVDDGVALVVVALANEPGEYVALVLRVKNARVLGLAVEGGDVVPGD